MRDMTRLLTFLLLLVSVAAHAVELVGPVNIQVGQGTAVLTWKTDVACGTRFSYGPRPESLDRKIEGAGVTGSHRVELTDLREGSVYYYSLGSARLKLAEGSFTATPTSTATKAGSAPAPATAKAEPEATAPKKSLLERVTGIFAPTTPAPAAKPKAPVSPATPTRAPPTRQTWGNIHSLQDHFDRHGPDFQSRNPDDYAAEAWRFLQRAKAGELPMKWDSTDGTLRVFDPKTRAFAAYNRDGTTKTYFRPNNAAYWQRQPGNLIKPVQLPF